MGITSISISVGEHGYPLGNFQAPAPEKLIIRISNYAQLFQNSKGKQVISGETSTPSSEVKIVQAIMPRGVNVKSLEIM